MPGFPGAIAAWFGLAASTFEGASCAQEPAIPTLTLPAFTGYAHPDPDAMQRRGDGSVERCDGSLYFYFFLEAVGDLTIRLERTAAGDTEPNPSKLVTIVHPMAEDLARKNTSATTVHPRTPSSPHCPRARPVSGSPPAVSRQSGKTRRGRPSPFVMA